MKLVIDIPKEKYEAIKDKYDTFPAEWKEWGLEAIRNGKELEAIEEKQKTDWVPVSERLPEHIGLYLVTLEYMEHGQSVTTLWYHGRETGWNLRVADVVVAWMPLPLPKAYKESEV